jgi:hypothetical protein
MGINARSAVHPRFTRHSADVLRSFAWCEFQLIDPNTPTGNANFDVWTNTTDSEPVILWQGRGQMQVFRQTLNAEIPAGGITQVRSLRFTVPMADMQGIMIRKGLRIRIVAVDANGDQDVMSYVYTVTSGVGAVLGWSRTIEAEVDSGRVI